MKKIFKEFEEFALRSDVLNIAISVIIGGAAGKMVSSLVESILMPIIGVFLGGRNFSSLAIKVGDASIMYGEFIQAIIDFLIISFFVFLLIKLLNTLEKKVLHHEEAEKKDMSSTEQYLKEIKELLEAQNKSSKS